MITIILPAHNEEKIIKYTIESIYNQTYPVSRLIVVSDNSTDKTVEYTKQLQKKYKNLILYETVNNKTKKAGALNQVFDKFGLDNYTLTMDADTVLDKNLIQEAVSYMESHKDVGVVCSKAGVLPKEDGYTFWQKMLWHVQHLEYANFDTYRIETLNKVRVCHGMCTVYRKEALLDAVKFRKLKRNLDGILDDTNLVEDLELTMCIGQTWKTTVNLDMLAYTEVLTNTKELWTQRCRWYRGGVDCLKQYGLNKMTIWDLFGHIFFFLKLFITILVFIVTPYLIITSGVEFNIISLYTITLLFGQFNSVYRLTYLSNPSCEDLIIRLLLIPETLFYAFNCFALLKAYYYSLTNKEQKW
jgi:biofilm PGA synthesis N-glycosyltransferase PgaC